METNPIHKLCRLNPISESKFILFRQLIGYFLVGVFANFVLSNQNLFFGSSLLSYLHLIGITASIFFALNHHRRLSAIVILGILAFTLSYSPFSMRVYPGYIGLYLIYTLFIKPNEGRFSAKNENWSLDPLFHTVFIFVMAFSFTYSGITKLSNQAWIDGSALSIMQNNPRFELYFSSLKNEITLKALTWAVLAIELLFFPLYCLRKTRALAVYMLGGLFLGLLIFTKIPIVIICMLLFIFYCHESGSSPKAPSQ